MEHFVQLVKTGIYCFDIQTNFVKKQTFYVGNYILDTLSKFDYGKEENLKRYGTEKAPAYSMTANVAPVVIYYSENDRLISLNVNIFDSYL